MKTLASGRSAPLLLLVFVFLMLLPGTGTVPLLDRDEPRFATASREMAERADWIKPTFNGRDRFDKPALSYWLMRGGYAVFGQNELGARLPTVLCAAALVLAVWFFGARWFDPETGLLAGLGLAACILRRDCRRRLLSRELGKDGLDVRQHALGPAHPLRQRAFG